MSPGAVRRIVIAVCVAGIAGMIVSSIADNNGAALTAGRVAADAHVEMLAADVEERVGRLVAQGAAEEDARDLVRSAVKLGRARA